jgi:glutamate synthase (NADPH/NADH)
MSTAQGKGLKHAAAPTGAARRAQRGRSDSVSLEGGFVACAQRTKERVGPRPPQADAEPVRPMSKLPESSFRAGGCEKNTGDGAGILVALPHKFFREVSFFSAKISSNVSST